MGTGHGTSPSSPTSAQVAPGRRKPRASSTSSGYGRGTDNIAGDALLSLGALTFLSTAYLLLRPAEPVARLSADDEARMRALLTKHGQLDSLGYFALRRDKSVIWSPTGKA